MPHMLKDDDNLHLFACSNIYIQQIVNNIARLLAKKTLFNVRARLEKNAGSKGE